MTFDSGPLDSATLDGSPSELVDALIYIAMSDSETESRKMLREAEARHSPKEIAAKGKYVVWLLDTQAKIKDCPAIQASTGAQREKLGLTAWVSHTLVMVAQMEAAAMHLRRLLNLPDDQQA